MRITFGLAFGVGLPGVISLVAERVLSIGDGQKLFAFQNTTMSTPIAYACRSVGRFEWGVCAPYVSYGRGHPIYGDRISVFIPLVCAVQLTASGATGGTIHLPLPIPFTRLGITLLVTHPRIAPVSRFVLSQLDRVIASVRRGLRRGPRPSTLDARREAKPKPAQLA